MIGCSDKPTATSVDAGAGANVDAVIDAGPPPQTALDVRVTFQIPDAGTQHVVLEVGTKSVVPQAARIELETNQALRNYRVRLFDEADKVIPSNDSVDDQPERLHYVIGLEAPLKTGYRYAIVFDAQTGAAMLDSLGRPISDLRYDFVIAGDRQKPEPVSKKKPAPKKKKR